MYSPARRAGEYTKTPRFGHFPSKLFHVKQKNALFGRFLLIFPRFPYCGPGE